MGTYLIISHSARALAESAKKGNYSIHCLDYFADEDTRTVSDSVKQLQFDLNGFNEEELIEAVQLYLKDNPGIVIVACTGFEKNPQQLNRIKELTHIISNTPETITKVKNPDELNTLLTKHSIGFPRTFLSEPKSKEVLLIKKYAGVGGGHIQWLKDNLENRHPDSYFQEYVSGDVLSAVFLASKDESLVVGFNKQLQTDQFSDRPFLYHGAITLKNIDKNIQKQIVEIIDVICKESGLRGLCGVDFVVNENNEIYILEINPRPPATFELHDNEHSLFKSHIDCFSDRSINFEVVSNELLKGYLILYARQDIYINDEINWPDWIKDRPGKGNNISCQSPVCSVHAEAKSMDEIKETLVNRLNKIESKILSMQNAA